MKTLPNNLTEQIIQLGKKQGFQDLGISGIDLGNTSERLNDWLTKQYHGEMHYMQQHGEKRYQPATLIPGTLSIISARMDYLTLDEDCWALLKRPEKAYISRYALGRDYHKILRKRLQNLAKEIAKLIGEFGYRVFTDSAPVMEKSIAEHAGLGWIGKHTNLVNKQNGSWFFLGEIYTDLPLAPNDKAINHCGNCQSCLDVCPTKAFVSPYKLDARKCISYLTIEFKGSIPLELRSLMGNRIYGCDDCLLICPWNRFAKMSDELDFKPRHDLDQAQLIDLFNWTENEFLDKLQGSPIRRIGHNQWIRNIAVALGNGEPTSNALQTLKDKQNFPDANVQEHIHWAISSLQNKPQPSNQP